MSQQMQCSPTLPESLKDGSATAVDPAQVRASFPIFQKHPDLIYFDSASTAQKPRAVIDTVNRYHEEQCANAGRAAYSWSTQLDRAIGECRSRLAAFINGQPEDLAFTSGATESLNTVAMAWGLTNLNDGDEVMVCQRDHKSAVLPWYNLKALLAKQGKTIHIKNFQIHEVGDYDLKSIKDNLTERTRLIAMAHIHHVFGLDMEVSEIREIVGDKVLISLDASQSVGHIPVDVQTLDVDFVSFSGHKMFAATGTGALWVNPRVKDSLHPVKIGGKSEASVDDNGDVVYSHKTTAELLEAGTQNISGILTFKPAVETLENIGISAIHKHLSDLTVYLYNQLVLLPGVVFAPGMGICRCEVGYGIIAFRFEQLSNLDLAFVLDEESIFVRSGDHCTYARDESEEYVRVSMHAYNSQDDIDQFIGVLAGLLGVEE